MKNMSGNNLIPDIDKKIASILKKLRLKPEISPSEFIAEKEKRNTDITQSAILMEDSRRCSFTQE